MADVEGPAAEEEEDFVRDAFLASCVFFLQDTKGSMSISVSPSILYGHALCCADPLTAWDPLD